MAVDDDSELVRAAQAGDASALERLLWRYQPQLWRYASRICGSSPEAEDGLLATVRGVLRFSRVLEPRELLIYRGRNDLR